MSVWCIFLSDLMINNYRTNIQRATTGTCNLYDKLLHFKDIDITEYNVNLINNKNYH